MLDSDNVWCKLCETPVKYGLTLCHYVIRFREANNVICKAERALFIWKFAADKVTGKSTRNDATK